MYKAAFHCCGKTSYRRKFLKVNLKGRLIWLTVSKASVHGQPTPLLEVRVMAEGSDKESGSSHGTGKAKRASEKKGLGRQRLVLGGFRKTHGSSVWPDRHGPPGSVLHVLLGPRDIRRMKIRARP